MPVKKVRSLTELEDSLWLKPGDPALGRAIAAAWEFALRTVAPSFPPGVYRHRSVQDAARLREDWEAENFRVFWQRRGLDPRRLMARAG